MIYWPDGIRQPRRNYYLLTKDLSGILVILEASYKFAVQRWCLGFLESYLEVKQFHSISVITPMSLLGKMSLFFSKGNCQKLYNFAKYAVYSTSLHNHNISLFSIYFAYVHSEMNCFMIIKYRWVLEVGSLRSNIWWCTVFPLGKLSLFPQSLICNLLKDLKLFPLAKCCETAFFSRKCVSGMGKYELKYNVLLKR